MRSLVLALFILFFAACSSPQFQYTPAEYLEANDPVAATYLVPSPTDAKSEIKVLSYGVEDLSKQKDMADIQAMHMRIEITNNQTESWTLNTADQTLSIGDQGKSSPAYINLETKEKELPLITIHPKEKKTVDLYYTLPEDSKNETEISKVQLSWRVQTADQKIHETTSFERIEVSPNQPHLYPPVANTRSWWNGWNYFGW